MAATLRIAVVAAALVLAACGVTSQHPLSDEKTSVLDERLIGVWEAVPGDSEKNRAQHRLYVGRREGTSNTLECVWLEVKGDAGEKRVHVTRIPLYTTKLGGHRYVSAGGNEGGNSFIIARYDLSEPDLLEILWMDDDVVAEAIEKGELAGTVKRKKSGGLLDIEHKEVRIMAEPAGLSAWVEKNTTTCYRKEQGSKMRRLDFEKGKDEPVEKPWPLAEERRMKEGHAPAPYTADQIRVACPAGRRSTYRIEGGPHGEVLQTFVFRNGNEEGTDLEVSVASPAGNALDAPKASRSTWSELQSHASYPAEMTTIEEETIEVPAGRFRCMRYTVRYESGESDKGAQVVKAWFAYELPGPPVLMERYQGEKRVFRMILLETGSAPK